ncbi:unnamed protein product [Schistocephalus solidus]|uniref:Uncharacterized protein n=1 Tax=Schistocephalus solidus TaxID=70667 RepID=A0A183SXL1_SCHSO|nr:unnamed protein product [Schistocephalus solidus]
MEQDLSAGLTVSSPALADRRISPGNANQCVDADSAPKARSGSTTPKASTRWPCHSTEVSLREYESEDPSGRQCHSSAITTGKRDVSVPTRAKPRRYQRATARME